jgi:hypothetical protein
VAAHSLTLCLFCRRIETQCSILGKGAAEDGRVTLDAAPHSAWPDRIMIAKLGDLTRDGRSTHNCPPYADNVAMSFAPAFDAEFRAPLARVVGLAA